MSFRVFQLVPSLMIFPLFDVPILQFFKLQLLFLISETQIYLLNVIAHNDCINK